MVDHPRYDHLFKIIVIGDYDVGKSSLQIRYVDDSFPDIGFIASIDFRVKYIPMDGKLITIQLWDTYGGERFRTITKSYFRGTHGVILVYDITSQKSFENMKSNWFKQAERDANENVNKLLIGNRCDLEAQRVVSYDEAKKFADQVGMPLVETSAKDGTNVEQAFVTMIALIKRRISLLEERLDYEENKTVVGPAGIQNSSPCCRNM